MYCIQQVSQLIIGKWGNIKILVQKKENLSQKLGTVKT